MNMIKKEGTLKEYESINGKQLDFVVGKEDLQITCGETVEVFILGKWVETSIEMDGVRYYGEISGYKITNLNGKRARIKVYE